MRIKSKTFSLVWKIVLLVLGAWGLLDGSGILAGAYTPAFPHMFTNVSNLFAWGYFAGGVALFCGAMLAAFITLGYLIFGIDRLLGRRRKDQATRGS